MPSPLDAYLDEVTAQLTALPVKRRTEELREIRQHLLNAVTVNKELGQSEEEAAQNAVTQFGTPEDLGENLVWAWRREEKLNKRSFWSTAVFSLAVCVFGEFLLLMFEKPYFNFQSSIHSPAEWLWWIICFRFAGPIFIGLVTSLIFPKRAGFGGVFGPGLYFALCIPASFHQLDNVAMLCLQNGLVILIVTGAGRRARQAWSKRKRTIRA